MKMSLRNRHLHTWIVLVILLPLLIGLSMMQAVTQKPDVKMTRTTGSALGEVVARKQTGGFFLRLRKGYTGYFLEVESGREIVSPALFVYVFEPDIKEEFSFESEPLGALQVSRVTHFDLPGFDGVLGVVIADKLHKQVYATAELTL